MGTLRHGKQILLFLSAVLVPSLTLVLFTTRIVRQEKELSVKRLADDRERRAQEIGREILLRLERMKLEEAQKLEASLARPDAARPGRSEVVMLGFVEDGRLILPWERSSSSAAVRSPAARDPRVATALLVPVSLALYLPFSVLVVMGQEYLPNHVGTASGVTVVWYYRRIGGYDWVTAFFSGMPAGTVQEDGTYPEGTLFRKVDDRLHQILDIVKEYGKEGDNGKKGKDDEDTGGCPHCGV